MEVFDIPYFDMYLCAYVTKDVNSGDNLQLKLHAKAQSTCLCHIYHIEQIEVLCEKFV